MKNILKVVLTILLFTPGSFVIPSTLIIGIVHHVSSDKTKVIQTAESKKTEQERARLWTRFLRKKLKLPAQKIEKKKPLTKVSEVFLDR